MLVKEMHIALDIAQQMISSNRKVIVEPEEKDFLLNLATRVFIKRKIDNKDNPKNKGFEDDQQLYDGLEELKRTAFLTTYMNTVDDKVAYVILPEDYLHRINSSSKIYRTCSTLSISASTVAYRRWVVPMPVDAGSGSPLAFYAAFKILRNASSICDIAALYPSLTALRSYEARFIIINLVLEYINRTYSDIKIYWEKYDDYYAPESFIIISTNVTYTTFQVTYTGSTAPAVSVTTTSRSGFTIAGYAASNIVNRHRDNRLMSSSISRKAMDHSFMKTHYESPISYLENRRLNIYYDVNWLPLEARVEYLKRPRLINIFTNQTCELNPNYHQDVVDIAVELIKARTEDPAYNIIVQENLRNE